MLHYCAAVVWHYGEKRKTISQDNRWDNGREECAAGGKRSTSMKDSNTAWRISSAANSLECNTSCSVVWKQATGGPGPLEPTAPAANAYLYYNQKGILFPSDDYSATPAVLFIWLRAQTICIDSLFIHCWTRHCIYECRRNGPNYGERCLPATPRRSAAMKVSNWEEKSNQRPLVVFCKFKNPNMEKHSPLRRTVVHFCCRLDETPAITNRRFQFLLITKALPAPFTKTLCIMTVERFIDVSLAIYYVFSHLTLCHFHNKCLLFCC